MRVLRFCGIENPYEAINSRWGHFALLLACLYFIPLVATAYSPQSGPVPTSNVFARLSERTPPFFHHSLYILPLYFYASYIPHKSQLPPQGHFLPIFRTPLSCYIYSPALCFKPCSFRTHEQFPFPLTPNQFLVPAVIQMGGLAYHQQLGCKAN